MNVVEIYRECGDFYETVRRSGLPLRVVHFKLLKSGILKIQDKIRYGNQGGRMGGMAEELFQKLVPEAIDANKYWKVNNNDFDFMYKDLKIDVKYSSCFKKTEESSNFWSFRVNRDCDLIVAFLEKEKGKELKEYYIALAPVGIIKTDVKCFLREFSDEFYNFVIDNDDLIDWLDMYAGVI